MTNNRSIKRPLAVLVSLLVTVALALTAGSAASAPQAAAPTARSVAHSGEGQLSSRIVGTTGNGRTVTGKFIPTEFSKNNGKVKARGMLLGVVHNSDGSTRTFSVMRTMRVKSINGAPASARAANSRATCDILHLVLAPLDLDLLGLQVHLDRVVLDIVAQTGAGNLLGNLLCAVTGLLDGGLDGALGRLVQLLNQILGRLGLGL